MKRQERYPETSTFHYYNANPKNRLTPDCWLRAICTGLNEPYNDVLREMVEIHIQTGYEMSSDQVIDRYLASKGWIKHKQPRCSDNTKYSGKMFCLELADKNERYIANIGGHHMVAIVDGKVNDTWDSTNKCIGNYWTKGN